MLLSIKNPSFSRIFWRGTDLKPSRAGPLAQASWKKSPPLCSNIIADQTELIMKIEWEKFPAQNSEIIWISL